MLQAPKGEGKTSGVFFAKNGYAYVPNPQGGEPVQLGLLSDPKVVHYIREQGLKALCKKLQPLAAKLPTDWLAVVSRLQVERCAGKERSAKPARFSRTSNPRIS